MKDKVVVITGASSGIGAHLAREVAARGGVPVLAARRLDQLAEVARTALAPTQPGDEALIVATDVTKRAEVERLRDKTLARYGRIDVWVNNAGRGISRMVSELTDEDFDEMMLVNVKSALYGAQAVLPHFRARKAGHLINVSSMLGRVPIAGVRSAYSAAKHALNSLTANLRMELAAELPDVHVSLFLPGVVATDFGLNARHGGVDNRQLPNAQPVEEVAAALADLIERPRPELYSRDAFRDMVTRYYADVGAAEQQPPFTSGSRR